MICALCIKVWQRPACEGDTADREFHSSAANWEDPELESHGGNKIQPQKKKKNPSRQEKTSQQRVNTLELLEKSWLF